MINHNQIRMKKGKFKKLLFTHLISTTYFKGGYFKKLPTTFITNHAVETIQLISSSRTTHTSILRKEAIIGS